MIDMSEICPDCLQKITGERNIRWKYVISSELDLCEECGEIRQVVVRARFLLLRQVLDTLWRVLLLPWLIWRELRKK